MKSQATLFTTLTLAGALLAGALTSAHASYLDPGSGSYLFQIAVAGSVGVVYGLRHTLKDLVERWRAWRAARKP